MTLLEAKTIRVNTDGTKHDATLFLLTHNGPHQQAPKESVITLLHQTEHPLVKSQS